MTEDEKQLLQEIADLTRSNSQDVQEIKSALFEVQPGAPEGEQPFMTRANNALRMADRYTFAGRFLFRFGILGLTAIGGAIVAWQTVTGALAGVIESWSGK